VESLDDVRSNWAPAPASITATAPPRERVAVGTVRHERVEYVGDRDDARGDRDILAASPSDSRCRPAFVV